MKTYSDILLLPTFEERFEYLKLGGKVGARTFGGNRWLNQKFYTSKEWRELRDKVVIRDNGCDLACDGRDIFSHIHIHHINPITEEDFENPYEKLLNLENMIVVSSMTHKAIHYGDKNLLFLDPVERHAGDTCLWKG